MFARESRRAVLALIVAVTLPGCAASLGGTGSGLQSDVDTLRVSVDRLRQEQARDRARVDALERDTAEPEAEAGIAEMRDRLDIIEAQVYALARRLEGSDEQMGGLTYEIQRLRYQLEAPGPLPGSPVRDAGG
jgi:chaperonin cofactor prefoldin